jgi:hypothetical protein
MDFAINKSDFETALDQILVGRHVTAAELVSMDVDSSGLALAAMGTSIEVPANCHIPGSGCISVRDIARLRKISATYQAGPVHIRLENGRIRFERTLTEAKLVRKKLAAIAIDIPSDARPMDYLALPAIFSAEEIRNRRLHAKVEKAQETMAQTFDRIEAELSTYDFAKGELYKLAKAKLKAHADATRRALFPDEDTADNADEQNDNEGQMSESEMKAELDRLREENAKLKAGKEKGGISLKVSEKGAVSLYGMGRFPVTLYKEQWLRVLASAPEIEAFIRENEAKLKTKE